MAAKKKKAVKATKAENCACGCGDNGNLEEYLLIFVAGLGLVGSFGTMIVFPSYVPVVSYVLIGVIGVKKLMDKHDCNC